MKWLDDLPEEKRKAALKARVYKKGQSCGNGKPEDTGNKKMDE